MAEPSSTQHVEAPQPARRRAWEEPAIALERSLEAAAQDPLPGGRREGRGRFSGVLRPLGISGGNCD